MGNLLEQSLLSFIKVTKCMVTVEVYDVTSADHPSIYLVVLSKHTSCLLKSRTTVSIDIQGRFWRTDSKIQIKIENSTYPVSPSKINLQSTASSKWGHKSKSCFSEKGARCLPRGYTLLFQLCVELTVKTVREKADCTLVEKAWVIKGVYMLLPTSIQRKCLGMTSSTSMTLAPPTMVNHDSNIIEVSLHKANASVKRELDMFLRAVISEDGILKSSKEVLIIATCQESKTELLNWGGAANTEKDRLLFNFRNFAEEFCRYCRNLGYWADYADPASGLLMNSPGQLIWPEVQALARLRGYKQSLAGPCHILIHPLWQSRMYPATIFTNAPEAEVRKKLEI